MYCAPWFLRRTNCWRVGPGWWSYFQPDVADARTSTASLFGFGSFPGNVLKGCNFNNLLGQRLARYSIRLLVELLRIDGFYSGHIPRTLVRTRFRRTPVIHRLGAVPGLRNSRFRHDHIWCYQPQTECQGWYQHHCIRKLVQEMIALFII